MAAIDKIYVKNYDDYNEFRLWCMVNKPSLLYNFYDYTMTEEKWYKWKENIYESGKKASNIEYDKYGLKDGRTKAINNITRHYLSLGCKLGDFNAEEDVDMMYKEYNKFLNKEEYIENMGLPITNFRFKQDRYLKWHCQLGFIRDYLHKNCGVKERWYYKLFFKN